MVIRICSDDSLLSNMWQAPIDADAGACLRRLYAYVGQI